MSAITRFGPGDPETWPPYSGHPLDPRAPEPSDQIWTEDEINSVLGDFMERLPDDFERTVARCLNSSGKEHLALLQTVERQLMQAFWDEIEEKSDD